MARSIERLGERGTPLVMVNERYFSVMAAWMCGRVPTLVYVLRSAQVPQAPRGCGAVPWIPQYIRSDTHENRCTPDRHRAAAGRNRRVHSAAHARRHALRRDADGYVAQ